ncbi:MAG: alpha/beta hydrolase [Armatimonadota bacterium]|nr:MAG: alpha/beta hydrolase [Armatimonadota bacterium]
MIFVRQYGGEGGRSIVGLHGWGGDHREFAAVAARLPTGFRLLSPDLPGYGESLRPDSWDVGTILDAVEKALKSFGAFPCVMAGFCSGAALAAMLARREGVATRLVMIDPFAFVPWYFRLFLAGSFGRRAYSTTFQSAAGRAVTDRILKRMQRSGEDFTRAFESLDHEVTLQYLRLLNTLDARRELRGFGLPVDIVHGDRTFGAVRRSVEIYRQLLPQARVHVLRGAGHLPMVRAAAEIAAILSDESREREAGGC